MRLLNFIVSTIRHIVEVVDAKIDAIQVDHISKKLDERAAQSDAKNWRTSLANRRELAAEFGRADYQPSADGNIWLHGKLLEALAERDIRLPRD
jgi:uncharacterized protein DUF3597